MQTRRLGDYSETIIQVEAMKPKKRNEPDEKQYWKALEEFAYYLEILRTTVADKYGLNQDKFRTYLWGNLIDTESRLYKKPKKVRLEIKDEVYEGKIVAARKEVEG